MQAGTTPTSLSLNFAGGGDLYKLTVIFQIAKASSQRKLGSSVFTASKALDPSFRWDDEQRVWRAET